MALTSLLAALERLSAFARLLNTLPQPGEHRLVAGLAGSSDATLVATLSTRLPDRFFVVVAETVPDAERWLADLQTLTDGGGVSLYPPREGFGEAEPHLEVAGERVETLERVNRGQVRILLTTARALLERTRMPRALRDLRLEMRTGDVRRLTELVQHLESIGFERVEMVEDVAQFSVRGGILDVYGFGMADPVRAEFWGDEIVDLRHFELTTQRSTRAAEVALVLPVDGNVTASADAFDRLPITALFPPDTFIVLPPGAHLEPELRRTWDEAQHHIELARRRGEDAPDREDLFDPPPRTLERLGSFGTIALAAPDVPRPLI